MSNRKLLVLTTIATVSCFGSPSFAEDKIITQVTPKSSAVLASKTSSSVFEYSARKLLGYVSEARVILNDKQKNAAIIYIDEALREIQNISNTREYLEMSGVQFGRILYGKDSNYYIPISDDTYAMRTYANGPFWSSDKATAVRDVELVTFDIAIIPEKATLHLQEAKKKLETSDYKAASNELQQLLEESVHEVKSETQPFIKLRDNIYLTRILIRQQNYDGARYTLKYAKSALDEYEKSVTDDNLRTNVKNLRTEIESLDKTIKSKDPTLVQQSVAKIDKWWNDMKSWADIKTDTKK